MSDSIAPRGKIRFQGELVLVMIAVLNSFAVDMLLYSGGGISAISSVPYALSESFPVLSLGTWSYFYQTTVIVVLMILRRKFVPAYLLSFFVGMAYSFMLDVHALWMNQLPLNLPLRLVYFAIGFVALTIGIAFSNHCKLPIGPTDLFPREVAAIYHVPYHKVKTPFDLGCLAVTALLCLFFIHAIKGIGIGTVICAFTMGRCIAWTGDKLENIFDFQCYLKLQHQMAGSLEQ